jgi:hypothetical protein
MRSGGKHYRNSAGSDLFNAGLDKRRHVAAAERFHHKATGRFIRKTSEEKVVHSGDNLQQINILNQFSRAQLHSFFRLPLKKHAIKINMSDRSPARRSKGCARM